MKKSIFDDGVSFEIIPQNGVSTKQLSDLAREAGFLMIKNTGVGVYISCRVE